MPCKHYKDALIEVAATGSVPSGELRAHLAECASCSATFAEEQMLFAGIDAGLHSAANAEVPPSLLPRVRARLDEVAVAPRLHWLQPLVFASASVALVLTIFLIARPHRTTPENVAKQSPVAPAPATHGANVNPEEVTPQTQTASATANHAQSMRRTLLNTAASGNPEVLVPPDERIALARFVATLNERSNLAAALVARAPEKKDALVTVDPLQIPEIEIKPLKGGETETSDGADE